MWDGHLGVQMGYIGWLSVWRRLPTIPWPDLPTRGGLPPLPTADLLLVYANAVDRANVDYG